MFVSARRMLACGGFWQFTAFLYRNFRQSFSYWTRSFKPCGQPCATGEVSTRLRVPIGRLGSTICAADAAADVSEGDDLIRLDFRYHTPHSAMVGKAVRAVSGLPAALILADLGYVTECGALWRIVSDFCSEVIAIRHALHGGGELPPAVQKFVERYFAPKARTPEQLAASERVRYVSREELMKTGRPAADANVDGEHLRVIHRFLNMTYDAYVHRA
jgi:hypothetical protein